MSRAISSFNSLASFHETDHYWLPGHFGELPAIQSSVEPWKAVGESLFPTRKLLWWTKGLQIRKARRFHCWSYDHPREKKAMKMQSRASTAWTQLQQGRVLHWLGATGCSEASVGGKPEHEDASMDFQTTQSDKSKNAHGLSQSAASDTAGYSTDTSPFQWGPSDDLSWNKWRHPTEGGSPTLVSARTTTQGCLRKQIAEDTACLPWESTPIEQRMHLEIAGDESTI